MDLQNDFSKELSIHSKMCQELGEHSYGSPLFMLNDNLTYHYVVSCSVCVYGIPDCCFWLLNDLTVLLGTVVFIVS